MLDNPLNSLCTKQWLIKWYSLTAPSNRQVWHKAFVKVGPDAGPEPRRSRRLQICLGPRRQSPKEWCLRRQAINLTPPKKVKACGDGLLRLVEINHPTRMLDSQLKKLLYKAGVNQAYQLLSVRDLYRRSLTLMQIRQINLPVSLYLPETSFAPSRSYTSSSDCFIFGIILLSLSLGDLYHWAVINVVFLHYLIFIWAFKFILAHLIMHYFVFWRFILQRLF